VDKRHQLTPVKTCISNTRMIKKNTMKNGRIFSNLNNSLKNKKNIP
jgi:hypothetical protein